MDYEILSVKFEDVRPGDQVWNMYSYRPADKWETISRVHVVGDHVYLTTGRGDLWTETMGTARVGHPREGIGIRRPDPESVARIAAILAEADDE